MYMNVHKTGFSSLLNMSCPDTFRRRSPKRLSIFSYIYFIKTKLHSSIRYPPIRYPSIRYPPIRYPSIRYPPIQYPSIRYPSIRYPSIRYPSFLPCRLKQVQNGAVNFCTLEIIKHEDGLSFY